MTDLSFVNYVESLLRAFQLKTTSKIYYSPTFNNEFGKSRATLVYDEERNFKIKLLKGEDYRIEVVTLINAEFLLGVLSFCRRVQDSQPKVAALLQYPSDIKLVKEKGSEEVVRADIEWKNHSRKSFANTAFTEQGGVPIVTDLAMYALLWRC